MPEERIIRDPLYDYITYPKDSVVSDLIDTPEFQRLRWIRQLGLASFVFPNAEHSRFSHSLGTYHLAKKFDYFLTGKEKNSELYIAALLHDIGHLPLSHTFEKEANFKHEQQANEIIRDSKSGIYEVLKRNGFVPDKIADLMTKPSRPMYHHHMISSQLDVDRFDYLRRDSYFTGNPCGFFDVERVLRMVKLNKSRDLRVPENGLLSVENYLISRYSMYYQVYLHKIKVSMEEMLIRAIRKAKYLEAKGELEVTTLFEKFISGQALSLSEFNAFTDDDVFNTLRKWSRVDDETLKQLSTRILTRKPFKLAQPVKPMTYKELKDLEKKMNRILSEKRFDPEYFYIVSEQKHLESYRPYGPDKETKENAILTMDDDDISNRINVLKGKSLQFIFVPHEFRVNH